MGFCRTCAVRSPAEDQRNSDRGRRSEENPRSPLLFYLQNEEDERPPSITLGIKQPTARIGSLVKFSIAEIRSATRDFHPGRLLGRGALSRVYRGKFETSTFAVKRLQGEERECKEAFFREIIAGDIRHPNIVPLLGFCVDRSGFFLVYKFAALGSLDHVLHQERERVGEDDRERREKERKRGVVLSWGARWKIAIGIGRAMEYLHHGTENCVIHRDIKPANILLSSSKTPMLSDFGMSVWTRGSLMPIFCESVEGTFGYLAPEYFQHGKLSDKTDVFSFGVVLLELITGRRPIDHERPNREKNLLLWAKPLLRGGCEGLATLSDPSLTTKCSSSDKIKLISMARTAMACLGDDDSKRPSIVAAMDMLQRSDLELPAFSSKPPELQTDITKHLNLAMKQLSDVDEGT